MSVYISEYAEAGPGWQFLHTAIMGRNRRGPVRRQGGVDKKQSQHTLESFLSACSLSLSAIKAPFCVLKQRPTPLATCLKMVILAIFRHFQACRHFANGRQAPCAENDKINGKAIGAFQSMGNNLFLLLLLT